MLAEKPERSRSCRQPGPDVRVTEVAGIAPKGAIASIDAAMSTLARSHGFRLRPKRRGSKNSSVGRKHSDIRITGEGREIGPAQDRLKIRKEQFGDHGVGYGGERH